MRRGWAKKLLDILRFVSMLFFNIWKGDEQKNCARYFTICMYAFFKNIWKGDEQKNCARYFQIRKYAFFLIWIFFSMNGSQCTKIEIRQCTKIAPDLSQNNEHVSWSRQHWENCGTKNPKCCSCQTSWQNLLTCKNGLSCQITMTNSPGREDVSVKPLCYRCCVF